uniref:Uncharacterized protein n=1 Tax=Brassica oleracea var. oleracea TaxID=109376 RepID=A0A0D3AT32_BRAOL
MVEPEANFGRAGRSDTYLGELVELNQSDTYISELDELSELSELSDTSLELNELSDTEEGAGLVVGRNGHFSAHGKIHKKLNLGRFYTKFDWMFGLLKKSKLQQDVYFPFKTVLEKEQMIFGNKKQFASSGFDFVKNKETKGRDKTGSMMMRSGSEVVIVPSPKPREATVMCLIRMSFRLMSAWRICCIRQFMLSDNSKRRETPTLLLHQKNNLILPESSNAIGSVIMLTSAKTRNRWLLWSENVETKPDKEGFSDLLPTFDDHAHEPMAVLNKKEFSGPLNDIGAYDLGLGSFVSIQKGSDEEQNCGHQANQERSSSIQKPDQTQDLRTNLFEEGGNDALWTVVPCQDGAQLDPTKVSPSDEATMVEPEANFGRAGRSDTYLGELVELNQSDTYISELDEPSEISDASLELNELSDTVEEVGLVAGRNEPFSAHGKIHKKFNLGWFYTKFDQAFGDGLLPICIKKYQQKESKSWSYQGAFNNTLISSQNRLTLHPWQLAPVVQNTVFTDRSRNHPGVGSLIGIRSMSMTAHPRRSVYDTSFMAT